MEKVNKKAVNRVKVSPLGCIAFLSDGSEVELSTTITDFSPTMVCKIPDLRKVFKAVVGNKSIALSHPLCPVFFTSKTTFNIYPFGDDDRLMAELLENSYKSYYINS